MQVWVGAAAGDDFLQLQFIGVKVIGRWSELRGGRFSEVRNVTSYGRCNRGQVFWLLYRGWSLLRGVTNRGFTVLA